MNSQFIGCQSRLPGHKWEDYAGDTWVPSFGVGLEWRCEVCGSIRRYIIDVNGYVAQRSYWHPPGYSWPKHERPTNEAMRLEVLRLRKKQDIVRRPKNVTPIRKRGA